MSSTARLLLALAGILANQLLGCGATFNVFISSSQLESYFQGTADFSLVQGLHIGSFTVPREGELIMPRATNNLSTHTHPLSLNWLCRWSHLGRVRGGGGLLWLRHPLPQVPCQICCPWLVFLCVVTGFSGASAVLVWLTCMRTYIHVRGVTRTQVLLDSGQPPVTSRNVPIVTE